MSPAALIGQLLNEVTASGIASPSELHGASEVEISGLEKSMSLRLPSPYKAFLRAVGRGADFLSRDHWHFTLEELPACNANARPILDTAGFLGRWFCFASRMGEVRMFFLADGTTDDPPVYYWNEGIDPRIEKGFDSFADWLRWMVEDLKSLR